jgi:hypothetical protein
MRYPALVSGLTAAAFLGTAGCSGSSMSVTPRPAISPGAMPVLAASAVPGIPFTTSVLTAPELAKDAPIPGLASKIIAWGYLDGRERTFQGESRRLTLVVSRFLVFKNDTGARTFVAFVHDQSAAYFGPSVGEQPLVTQGRSGWLFTPASCACHLANPVVIGIVDQGSSVVWLEINGPAATSSLLTSLLDPAESAPASNDG